MLANIKTYLLTQGTVATFYYLVSIITPFEAVELPYTFVDDFFKPHFTAPWVYMSFFFLLMFGILFSSEENAKKCSRVILINSAIASVFFILYPTKITYMDYAPYIPQGISYNFMMMIRKYDASSNCFPSLHIANSIIACFFLNKDKKELIRVINIIWLTGVIWSVISTKQHYFYDVIGGAVLAFISLKVFEFLKKTNRVTV